MINTITLLGRITKDIELKTTQSGKSVVQFSVANETGYGDNKKTNFFEIVAWQKTAEIIAKFCKKGSLIAVTGELSQRTYEDSNGNKRNIVEIIARDIQFCDSKSESQPVQSQFAQSQPQFEELDDDKDLPF